MAYVRDNAVCRMQYEICRTGVRILSDNLWVNTSSVSAKLYVKGSQTGHFVIGLSLAYILINQH